MRLPLCGHAKSIAPAIVPVWYHKNAEMTSDGILALVQQFRHAREGIGKIHMSR